MRKGFTTLFLVLITGSLALSLALWSSTSSLWSIRGSFDNKDSGQAKALANACAEIALERIRVTESYVGTDTKNISDDECSYVVTNTGGNNRTIVIEARVNNFVRKIEITTTAFNPITIATWKEIE